MQYECRITVLETKCFPDLQEQYLADPKSGPCPFFKPGVTVQSTPNNAPTALPRKAATMASKEETP